MAPFPKNTAVDDWAYDTDDSVGKSSNGRLDQDYIQFDLAEGCSDSRLITVRGVTIDK